MTLRPAAISAAGTIADTKVETPAARDFGLKLRRIRSPHPFGDIMECKNTPNGKH